VRTSYLKDLQLFHEMKDFMGEKQRQRDCRQQISDRIKKRTVESFSCTSLGFYLFGFFSLDSKNRCFKSLHLRKHLILPIVHKSANSGQMTGPSS